jgi:hypothetical protein
MMKQSAQKLSTLSLVTADGRQHHRGSEQNSAPRTNSFDGWPNSVAPTLMQFPTSPQSTIADRWIRSLSLTDIARVNHATVRESSDHRPWPPEVVLTFMAAEVIKGKSDR